MIQILALAAVFASDADLTKIERTIAKEPVYQSPQPKYCLLVFGHEARKKVWLVHDGNALFVDRNGDGDLTGDGERVEGQADEYHGSKAWKFDVGEISAGGRVHKALTVFVASNSVFVQAQVDRSDFRGSGLAGRTMQLARGDELKFSESPQSAPIIQFDGPLTLVWNAPLRLMSGRLNDVFVEIGTPGLGADTFARIECEESMPKSVWPTAEIDFPSEREGQPPLRQLFELRERC